MKYSRSGWNSLQILLTTCISSEDTGKLNFVRKQVQELTFWERELKKKWSVCEPYWTLLRANEEEKGKWEVHSSYCISSYFIFYILYFIFYILYFIFYILISVFSIENRWSLRPLDLFCGKTRVLISVQCTEFSIKEIHIR